MQFSNKVNAIGLYLFGHCHNILFIEMSTYNSQDTMEPPLVINILTPASCNICRAAQTHYSIKATPAAPAKAMILAAISLLMPVGAAARPELELEATESSVASAVPVTVGVELTVKTAEPVLISLAMVSKKVLSSGLSI